MNNKSTPLKIRALRALTREGLTDEEIVDVFNSEDCTKRTIANWRKRNDISPGGIWTKNKEWRLKELHSKGYSDHKIAKMMGFHPQLIKDVREKLGLEANGRRVISDDDEKVRELVKKGCSDNWIAKELDWHKSSIKKYRIKNDIEPGRKHRKKGLTWFVLHGYNDVEIAKRFGLSSSNKIERMRKKNVLPDGSDIDWKTSLRICDMIECEDLDVPEISDRVELDELTVRKTIEGLKFMGMI